MSWRIEDPPQVSERVTRFKDDLGRFEHADLLRKRVFFGDCYVFEHEDGHFDFLKRIADHFKVHWTSVVIVGSSKLGFTLKPDERYRAFDVETSDVDVAIVSPDLFMRVWDDVFHKKGNSYWAKRDSFASYLFRGWLRPDFFAPVRAKLTDDWWEFFRSLKKDAPFGISGAIYRDWHFLESYQLKTIRGAAMAEKGISGDQ